MTGQVLDASWLFGGPRLPHFFSDIYTETEWDPPGLAVSMAANVATLTWSASPTAGVTSYDLYRRTPPTGVPFVPGSDTPVATGVTSPYNDSGLASATYEWQVFGNLTTWTPASVSGLVAWYDASDAGSITQSGGAVSQWNDLSGNGNHLVQATGANQPVTGSDTINGLNVLKSTGSAFMSRAATTLHSGQWSAFAVAKVTAASGLQQIIDQDDSVRVAQYLRVNGSNIHTITFDNPLTSNWSASESTVTGGTAFQTSAVRGASTIQAWLNGATSGPTATTGTPASGSTLLTIFQGGVNAGTNQLTGDIAELIFYSNALNSTDRAAVESYLKAKWGTP